MVEHVEFLVEEPSVEASLRVLLPGILGDISFAIYPHQGKRDLLDRLPDRMKGYAAWLPETYRIVVVVDRDGDDCHALKSRLERDAANAGLTTRTRTGGQTYQVVNRIAIEELEAWFFGDWNAVCQAYPGVNPNLPNKEGFRDPDQIKGGTWESLERILMRAGHFKSGLRKIEAARTIAKFMAPDQNRSKSFQVFATALAELAAQAR